MDSKRFWLVVYIVIKIKLIKNVKQKEIGEMLISS